MSKDGYIFNKSKNVKHLSILKRIILLPISFVWWAINVLIFSSLGFMAGIPMGLFSVILLAFSHDKVDIDLTLFLLFGWLICPVLWWYKYFAYGEYINPIIND